MIGAPLQASVVSEHLFVGETKTANRVLREIRTHCDWLKGAGHATSPITLHFSRPLIGGRQATVVQKTINRIPLPLMKYV